MIIQELIWESKNISHIARHNVKPEEVEDVCEDAHAYISKSRGQTIRLIGQTFAGRYLVIFLAQKSNMRYYVVTARDAELSERRLSKRK
jgi:uncharacterized DUF497 family protein